MALFKNDKPVGVPPSPAPPPAYAPPPPVEHHAPSPTTEESVLGPNVAITGDVAFEGSMRIEGKIIGKIMAQGRLTIARGAQVLGEVTAAEAVIDGMVQGNINATDRVELRSTAQVVGDIHSQRFVVQDGAKLLGQHEIDSESLNIPGVPGKAAHAAPAPAKHAQAHKAEPKGDPLASAF